VLPQYLLTRFFAFVTGLWAGALLAFEVGAAFASIAVGFELAFI